MVVSWTPMPIQERSKGISVTAEYCKNIADNSISVDELL